ncbi:MAG: family 2 glycosyl transferase [Candidatus Peregrinibacteria bacterium Gr01-1014_25]|nr:MAG: family 2 glycosyl transferase [Candidatus Peregrinibacteria bacterium Gr01-1014_25]
MQDRGRNFSWNAWKRAPAPCDDAPTVPCPLNAVHPSPALSVIIPTHRRAPILALCLERLARQTIADRLEVIVVSDGGDDETQVAVSEQRTANSSARCPLPTVRFINIPPCHQGVARNRGVAEATAPYVLFIGDDILLERDACEIHVQAHDSYGLLAMGSRQFTAHSSQLTAILGHTAWDPAAGITPAMRWLDRTGWQFGYTRIAAYAHRALPQAIQHRFTYTSHISLPTEIARRFPFREDVSLYGWEDVEWGLRLRDAGIALLYEPNARALHHHRLSLEDSLKRMETIGRSAVAMARMDPAFDRAPRGWKRLAYRCISLFPTMRGRHAKAFMQGIDTARTQA